MSKLVKRILHWYQLAISILHLILFVYFLHIYVPHIFSINFRCFINLAILQDASYSLLDGAFSPFIYAHLDYSVSLIIAFHFDLCKRYNNDIIHVSLNVLGLSMSKHVLEFSMDVSCNPKRKGDIMYERFVELVSLITLKDIHERIGKNFFRSLY